MGMDGPDVLRAELVSEGAGAAERQEGLLWLTLSSATSPPLLCWCPLFKRARKAKLPLFPHSAKDWLWVCPQDPYVEPLNPNVKVSGDGAFGGWLVHEGGALRRQDTRGLAPSLPCHARMQPEGGWTRKRVSPGSDHMGTLTSSPQTMRNTSKGLMFKPQVHGILLEQPEQTPKHSPLCFAWRRGSCGGDLGAKALERDS